MKKYRVVDYDQFRRFAKMVLVVFVVVLIAVCIKYIDKHDGLEPIEVEYHSYEIMYETSRENNRIKVPVAHEVVYKTIYR